MNVVAKKLISGGLSIIIAVMVSVLGLNMSTHWIEDSAKPQRELLAAIATHDSRYSDIDRDLLKRDERTQRGIVTMIFGLGFAGGLMACGAMREAIEIIRLLRSRRECEEGQAKKTSP